MKTILLVGNLTIDENITESGKYRGFGGSVYFAGKTIANLGGTSYVLSPRGNNLPNRGLKGINFLNKPLNFPHPLLFKNIIVSAGQRKQQAIIKKNSDFYDIDSALSVISAEMDAVIMCPVIDNLKSADISKIKKRFPHSLYILMPQGLLRKVDAIGNVKAKEITNEKSLISMFDIIIYSDKDIPHAYVTAKKWSASVATVIVTEGENGCSVYHNGRLNHVPAYRVTTIVDSTGSGDIFAGAFAINYIKNKNMTDALTIAHAVAGFSLRLLPNELHYTVEDIKSFAKLQNRVVPI